MNKTSIPNERIAEVVEFSPRIASEYYDDSAPTLGTFLGNLVAPLWWWTSRHVDGWGRDDDLTNLTWNASRLRWDVSVGGAENITEGAGLIAVNDRRYSFAGIWAALSLGAALGRPVRFAGRPEAPIIGPLLQRIGGLLPVDDDVSTALAAGELVVICAAPTLSDRRCGRVDPALIGAALDTGVPIYPAATTSSMFGRGARLDVLAPVDQTPRRGPLGSVETADRVREKIDRALHVFGEQTELRPTDLLSVPRLVRR